MIDLHTHQVVDDSRAARRRRRQALHFVTHAAGALAGLQVGPESRRLFDDLAAAVLQDVNGIGSIATAPAGAVQAPVPH
ncbi:MAG: hypothetical protein IT500_16135 [Rubrivivax sp.]|nr:hypothetical protein [Rubrivivax sp.]